MTGETVIVAHGLWMPARLSTLWLRRRLRAAGFAPVAFSYPSVFGHLDDNAGRLAEFAQRRSLDGPVHFVGHSLGGVLSVRMLQRQPLAQCGRVVCLGSPLVSCQVGEALLRWPRGGLAVGRSIAELIGGGGLRGWSENAELGVVAGNRPRRAGALFRRPEPNDGMVGVEETRLPGLADHCVLPVHHTELLWSKAVADAMIDFLRRGEFVSTERPA